MKDQRQKLSAVTVGLHWLVGVTIICLLAVGVYMKETEAYGLYPIHKSIGVIVFVVVLARVVWRLKSGWPEPVRGYAVLERVLSRVVQWILLVSSVLMPVSGMMMSGGGGHGISVFGLELLARNPEPANPQEVIPLNEIVGELGHEMHEILAWLLILALLLHIAGALKHHFFDRDGTLRRMLGAKVD